MEVPQNPLRLLTLAKMSAVRAAHRNLNTWVNRAEVLPEEFKDDLKILFYACYLLPELDSKTSHMFLDVLSTCVTQFDKVRLFEKNLPQKKQPKNPFSSKIAKIFIDMEDDIDFNLVLDGVQNIFQIDEAVANVIFLRVTHVVILNNLFVLAAFFGQPRAMDILLHAGADDFVTARKMAALGCEYDCIRYSHTLSSSLKCETLYKNTAKYKDYHTVVQRCDEDQEDVLNYFMYQTHLETLLDTYTSRTPMESFIKELTTPMCLWDDDNIMTIACYVDWGRVYQLSSFYKYRPDPPTFPLSSSPFTATPPTSPSSVDTSDDDIWDGIDY